MIFKIILDEVKVIKHIYFQREKRLYNIHIFINIENHSSRILEIASGFFVVLVTGLPDPNGGSYGMARETGPFFPSNFILVPHSVIRNNRQ